MREYLADISPVLMGGMEIGRFKDNSQYLVNARNWRVYEDGLRQVDPPASFSTSCDGFFVADSEQVILKSGAIEIGSTTYSTSTGNPWQYVHKDDFFIATNGNQTWMLTLDGLAQVDSQEIPTGLCLTEYNGQLLMANFPTIDSILFQDLRPNTVAWSQIMDATFALNVKNTSGYTHIDGASEILALHRLGDAIYVFATEGIWQLTPQVEPTPTYGVRKISGLGIDHTRHVAGSETRLFFISGNELYTLEQGLPKKLGYSEYITMFTSDVYLTYDEVEEVLYWTKGSFNYMLSNYGLTEVSYFPECFGQTLSGRAAYMTGSTDVSTRSLETSVISLNYPGVKTITSLECDFQGTMTGEIFTRNTRDGTWKSFGQINFNIDGTISRPVTGNMFRIILRGGDSVHSLRIRYKSSDRRFVRGTVQADAVTA